MTNPVYVDQVVLKSNTKRAQHLIAVFWSFMGLHFLGIISSYFELDLLLKLQKGIYISDEAITSNDTRQFVIGIIQLGLYITTIVVFLNWFRRAYGNLHRLKMKTRYSESMAIWSFFIPILYLFYPYQIMKEIWTKTQKAITRLDASYTVNTKSYLIGFWWALFIITIFVDRLIIRTFFAEETIENYIYSSEVTLLSNTLQILEAFLVILIVQNITKMEGKLIAEVEKGGGTVIEKQS